MTIHNYRTFGICYYICWFGVAAMTEVASGGGGLQVLSVQHYEAAAPANLPQQLVGIPALQNNTLTNH